MVRIDNNMEQIEKSIAEKRISDRKTKIKVDRTGVNGPKDIEQKQWFLKEQMVMLAHDGYNIASIAEKLNIARGTIYNYMAYDKEFEERIRAGAKRDIQIRAMVGVVRNMDKGDLGAQKYILDKTRYFEDRKDITEQNNTSFIDVVHINDDVETIAANMIDDYEIAEIRESGKDLLLESLYKRDKNVEEELRLIKEKMTNEQKEKESIQAKT